MSSGGLRWAIAWLSEKLAAQRRRARVFFQTPSSMSGRTLIRSYDSAGKSSSASSPWEGSKMLKNLCGSGQRRLRARFEAG